MTSVCLVFDTTILFCWTVLAYLLPPVLGNFSWRPSTFCWADFEEQLRM